MDHSTKYFIWKNETLFFHDKFNKSLEKFNDMIKNKKIIGIDLGSDFNKPIDYLPNNIKILKFRKNFNQPLDNLQI
jgi:hypothetical protein